MDVQGLTTKQSLLLNECRLERKDYFAALARLVALRSTCNRAKVGAIIVKDGRIISTGYAGAPANSPHCTEVGCKLDDTGSCIRTVHAEANAIAEVAMLGGNIAGSVMYCTMCPCINCAKLIAASHLSAVYYLDDYAKGSAAIDFLIYTNIKIQKLEERYEIQLSLK